MLKSVIKSILALSLYYFITLSLQELSKYILIRDEFLDIDSGYFSLVESVVLIILLTVSVFFIRKTFFYSKKAVPFDYKLIFLIVVIACFFRVIEDPFLRIKIILENLTIPETIRVPSNSSLKLTITFINIVILGSIFEELFFRKILLNFFNAKSLFIGVFISSFFFALIHFDIGSIDIQKFVLLFIFGFIAAIIYIRYGLLYAILFHMTYNLVWFLVKINHAEYWSLIRGLNFGTTYWVIIILSFISIVYLIYKIVKHIIKFQSLPTSLDEDQLEKTRRPSISTIFLK